MSSMFGKKLKELRAAAGLTQKQLADKSRIPLAIIRNYEQDKNQPSWENVQALADALGVSTEELRGGKK